MASAGLWGLCPSIDTVPASGRCTPAAIFISVDFPAPLPAEQADDLARLDVEIDPAKRSDAAE